ncbi:MAG: M23 family metallopeptidase [Nitrospirota bacterium]
MRRFFLIVFLLLVLFAGIITLSFPVFHGADMNQSDTKSAVVETANREYREISDNVRRGETLYDIFKRYDLEMRDLFLMREASAGIHRLKNLIVGHPYRMIVDDQNMVNSFFYSINDEYLLNIVRKDTQFIAEKVEMEYEKKIEHIAGIIKDNLISSIGEEQENLLLALNLADIFKWDIDFTTDLRNDDTFKIIVEGHYLDGEFKKYGDILSVEFINNGDVYRADRFSFDGEANYYNADGESLKRSFLKAPLNFRRISSGFSKKRFHPILKKYRPHHGLDYAAPSGTPVSTTADGTVAFAGYKKQYGRLVIIRHPNGYQTYYGHLSRFEKGIKRGIRIKQGDIIGYVGSSGLSTGPHLHYEVRIHGSSVNPLTLKFPSGGSIPDKLMADFKGFKDEMDTRLRSIGPSTTVAAKPEITESSTGSQGGGLHN